MVRRGTAKAAGFTLIEVMASLTLVAIVLPVAMKGVSMATGFAGSAKHRTEASSLAEAKLADLLATKEWQNGDLSGDFEPDWPGYRWVAEVREWEGETLQEVEVRVLWMRRGRERSVSITTLGYKGM